jgi:hypothetical protein
MLRFIYIWGSKYYGDAQSTDRWYREVHGPEYMRYWGPYMTRYETYRAIEPTQLAEEQFGCRNYRITDQWFISDEALREGRRTPGPPSPGNGSRIPGTRRHPRAAPTASTVIPGRPTEDFKGRNYVSGTKSCIRWVVMFRYPEGVSLEQGDRWFLDVHAKEVAQQPGLIRYYSHLTSEARQPLQPPLPGGPTRRPWHRLVEQWYESVEAWQEAYTATDIRYTPPPWAQGQPLPFLKPAEDFVSVFVGPEPDMDFFRDVRPRGYC